MDPTKVPLPARGARVTVPGGSFFFDDLAPDAVRSVVNTAMDVAMPHYAENVARSGRSMDPVRIEEAALMVVLYNLRVFNDWRQHWYLRWKRLRLTRSNLRNPLSHDQVVWYCRRAFGDGYAPHAAALLGMSPEEFATWEAARQKFWEMW
jgi:hypothetical protein